MSDAKTLLIIAPSPIDRQRLALEAVKSWHARTQWATRHILAQIPELDMFAQPEIWIVDDISQWSDPSSLIENCQGIIIATTEKLAEKSPWRNGEVVDLSTEKPWEREGRVARTVTEHAAARSKKITPELAVEFVRRIGVDHPSIEQELEKVLLYASDRSHVNEQDIAAVTQAVHNESGWQLAEAIIGNRTGQALTVADHLLNQGVALLSLTGQLRYQLDQALAVLTLDAPKIQKIYPQLRGKRLLTIQKLAQQRGVAWLETQSIRLARLEAEARQNSSNLELFWLLQKFILGTKT